METQQENFSHFLETTTHEWKNYMKNFIFGICNKKFSVKSSKFKLHNYYNLWVKLSAHDLSGSLGKMLGDPINWNDARYYFFEKDPDNLKSQSNQPTI